MSLNRKKGRSYVRNPTGRRDQTGGDGDSERRIWNRVQGSWKQLEGKVKAKWGMLTDDDLTAINGRREELEGKIQQRYGIAKDQARKQVDEWLASQGL
jgi:uncharacterized protein YjbJ (UPF0337 family)